MPAYRRGLHAALTDAGFVCDEPEDLEAWAGQAACPAILLTLRGEDDLDRLARLSAICPTVALLQSNGPVAYLQAFQHGACGVLPWDSCLDVIVNGVRAALEGLCLLPLGLLQAVATDATVASLMEADVAVTQPTLSEREIGWLRHLAAGTSVVELAPGVGYSEREMFRLLRVLYARLGATGRSDALVKASQSGLLDDPPSA